MNAFLSKGGIAGLLSFAAAIAAAFGKTPLSAILSDPATAQSVTIVASGVGAIVAGVLTNKAAPKTPVA